MQDAYTEIAEALKKVGYERVNVVPAGKLEHFNVMVSPVMKTVSKPRKDRALPAQIPELIMDPKTKNFAALSVLAEAGLSFDDVHVFNNDLIVRNVPVPAAKPATKKEPAKPE